MNTIRNFRDLGMIKSKYGTIKSNRLLRGGPLNNVSKTEKNKLLNKHELDTIIDFRSKHEIKAEPNQTFENVDLYNLTIIPDFDDEELNNMPSNMDFMDILYSIFVTHPQPRNAYKEFLEIVADKSKDGSIYFHCTAGKDRTGFAAAILLKILGVSDEDIFKDFLETNNNIKKDKVSLSQSFDDFNPYENMDEEMLYDVFGVKEDYLQRSFNLIKTHYGNFDNFIQEGLNIDSKTIATLRKNLII